MPRDQERRFDFCNFVLNTRRKSRFFNEVWWSDECQFSRQGTINTWNTHYWSLENPHMPPSALVGEHVVRNMEEHLNWPNAFQWTSESYTEILSGPLADFLEDEVPLWDLSCMWYHHDGGPAHKSAQPCTFLAQTFDTQIIGYGGHNRSGPDLSPLGLPSE
ncbi:uncharacterized protein TNCV_607561 [Trichonephila clavipes]|nr:uncharacterized protein TNCV_607561 [Trichonephila clavipes]